MVVSGAGALILKEAPCKDYIVELVIYKVLDVPGRHVMRHPDPVGVQ